MASMARSSQEASLVIYGCQVAYGEIGGSFLQRLHQLTGSDLAASSQRVGSTIQGGSWNLDFQIGQVNDELAFAPELRQNYSGVFIQVGLTTSPQNIIEDEGSVLTFRFQLDAPPPPGGLRVYVDSNFTQSLNRLDLSSIFFTPGAVTGGDVNSVNGDFDFTGFAFTITDTVATINIPVFDDEENGDAFDGLKKCHLYP